MTPASKALTLPPAEWRTAMAKDLREIASELKKDLKERAGKMTAGQLPLALMMVVDKIEKLEGAATPPRIGTQINIQVNGVNGGRHGLLSRLTGSVNNGHESVLQPKDGTLDNQSGNCKQIEAIAIDTVSTVPQGVATNVAGQVVGKRKRGRPRKHPAPQVVDRPGEGGV